MRKLFIVLAAFCSVVLSACVHRPYYKDLIGDAAGQKEISFRLLNAANGQPLAGVPIRVTAGNEKVAVTTDPDGHFKLPVKKGLMDPYTVVDVVRPSGVERYTIEWFNTTPPVITAPNPEPVITAPPATTVSPAEGQASDAGV